MIRASSPTSHIQYFHIAGPMRQVQDKTFYLGLLRYSVFIGSGRHFYNTSMLAFIHVNVLATRLCVIVYSNTVLTVYMCTNVHVYM